MDLHEILVAENSGDGGGHFVAAAVASSFRVLSEVLRGFSSVIYFGFRILFQNKAEGLKSRIKNKIVISFPDTHFYMPKSRS